MPSDEQLRTYAQNLPAIYREILSAFPRIEPSRKQGYALAFQTLAADFKSRPTSITLDEIIQACQELEEHGLVEVKYRVFVHPTPLGERLIGILTGQRAPAVSVPKLPSLPT